MPYFEVQKKMEAKYSCVAHESLLEDIWFHINVTFPFSIFCACILVFVEGFQRHSE